MNERIKTRLALGTGASLVVLVGLGVAWVQTDDPGHQYARPQSVPAATIAVPAPSPSTVTVTATETQEPPAPPLPSDCKLAIADVRRAAALLSEADSVSQNVNDKLAELKVARTIDTSEISTIQTELIHMSDKHYNYWYKASQLVEDVRNDLYACHQEGG